MRIVLLVVSVFGLLAVYLFFPALGQEVNQTVALLVRADNIAPLRDYLLSFGLWAPFISALLQLLTSILAPLPSFVLTFANAFVFGFWWGMFLTYTTALLASAVCFGLARALGRPAVERLATKGGLEAIDSFFERHGLYAVLIARLIPFINPDILSYAAGLTPLTWRVFLLSIAVGSLPSTVLYSYLGAQGLNLVGWLLIPLVGLGVLTFLLALWRARAQRRRSPDSVTR